MGRFVLQAVEAPASGLVPAGLRVGLIAVVDDGLGLAPLVAERLCAAGLQASAGEGSLGEATGLVYLGGLASFGDRGAARAVNRRAFQLARTLGARIAGGEGAFIVAQDTGGQFGLGPNGPGDDLRAWSAGLAALARTVDQEWPGVGVKAVDLERGGRSPEALADALAEEIVAGGPEREVGLTASGARYALCDKEIPAVRGAPSLSGGEVVVVSGGARGITAATVIALAKALRPRFVLLGRTALSDEPSCLAGLTTASELTRALMVDAASRGAKLSPPEARRAVARVMGNREIRDTLSTLEALGSEARYLPVDVTDGAALTAALDEVRGSWGPIRGVVHGAGILADKAVVDKTDEQFDGVFDTKVSGLEALLAATAQDELRFLCAYSSVAARCGNNGQSDYAMANEVLNKVLQGEARRRPGCVVRSLGWGPWEGGMVTPELKARFDALGVPLIPLDVGARMFVDEVFGDASGPVEMVLGGEPSPHALLAEGAAHTASALVHVDGLHQAYLKDHAIRGRPVVPVVLVLEWFARLAQHMCPGKRVAEVRDLRVLGGIPLPGFDGAGDWLTLKGVEVGDGLLRLEVVGEGGRRHYAAELALSPEAAAPRRRAAPQVSLEAFGDGPVYGSPLFHGEAFQVIERVEGISPAGCALELKGVRAAGWPTEPWVTDVAAMDGGLQAALLWTGRALGGASLPTRIAEARIHAAAPADGVYRCVLQGQDVSGSRATSDVSFFDAQGQLFAELLGVETHLVPNG